LNDTYPYPEGVQLEFKKNFHINQFSKYRETICAFLNTNGGHIIYGVLDNCIIKGCSIVDFEKDKILRYVDSMHTIMKKNNGENIPNNCLKVYIEEIAKDLFIIIISCYKVDNIENQYQFLSGDSWIRMNASNMKLTYGKLYTVQDTLNMKTKLYSKHEEELARYKKKINICEQDTILFINNILIDKQKKEKELIKKYTYINYSYVWIFILVIIFGYKELCV
jgi:predicted HTH transcriptional regulator